MSGQSDPVLGSRVAGKRALITGASSGVGLEIARRLAAAGAVLLLPVRDRARGERAVERIRETAPDAVVELRDLDLARLDSVRAFVTETLVEDRPLDLLILNAGVALVGERGRRMTEDGFELHFQTNFLAQAGLVLGIRPLLERSRTRIVVQGSIVSALAGVHWDDLQFERRYRALRAYGSSKTALGLFAMEFARRVDGPTVVLAHPGIVPDTAIAPGVRDRVQPALRDMALRRLGNRPQVAADPALLALVAELPADAGPACFAPSGWLGLAGPAKPSRAFTRISDPASAARIWDLAHEMLASAGSGARSGEA